MARAHDCDDYATDIEDSGSDYDYLFDDEAYVAGRQADYAIHKAFWNELRALQATSCIILAAVALTQTI